MISSNYFVSFPNFTWSIYFLLCQYGYFLLWNICICEMLVLFFARPSLRWRGNLTCFTLLCFYVSFSYIWNHPLYDLGWVLKVFHLLFLHIRYYGRPLYHLWRQSMFLFNLFAVFSIVLTICRWAVSIDIFKYTTMITQKEEIKGTMLVCFNIDSQAQYSWKKIPVVYWMMVVSCIWTA